MSSELNARVRRSMLVLQGRQVLLLAMNLGVGILLARKLEPAVFGLYGIATFCLSLVVMATNFGLAASLVQRKEDFGQHEVSVAFTLQTIVALGASVLVWVLAPLALLLYRESPPELVWIIRSLVAPMLLSPILTIARIQLERDIEFQKIATLDVVSVVVGNVVVLSMVFAEYGVWSFVVGNVAGAVVSTFLALRMMRYRPRFAFDRALSKRLLSFGVFFQLENLTNEAAGWIIPLISGVRLGPTAVGLLTWASSNGRRPLMIVDNVMKVAFPHFSRLQHDPVELGRQMGVYLRRLTFFCYSWGLLGLLLADPMTKIVYTSKWSPGVVCLQLFALGLIVDVANWVGGMTLTAIGGVKKTVKWTLTKSVLSIVGALALVGPLGIVGIPLASFLASAISGAGIMIDLRKKIPVDFSTMWKPAIPIVVIGMFYLPFAAANSLLHFPLPDALAALKGAALWVERGQEVARWVLGAVIIAWSGWWAWREFRPKRAPAAAA